MRSILIGILILIMGANCAFANNIESAYTTLDFDKGCVWATAASEEEAGMGGSAVCTGYRTGGKNWPVHFSESDIRQFVGFGVIANIERISGGFSQWNYVNTTIEWRLSNGIPFATILRWFIENVDPETSGAPKKWRGNVLVISTVAQRNNPKSCIVGYVDALANKNANELARDVADKIGADFLCGIDEPRYYGNRGIYSGTPNDLAVDQRLQ